MKWVWFIFLTQNMLQSCEELNYLLVETTGGTGNER